MLDNLITTIKSALQARILPLTTKVRMYTNANYRQGRLLSTVRKGLNKKISIKPRHKNDYYRVGVLLISKRLVFAIAMGVLLICVYYLTFVNPLFKRDTNIVVSYYYNSLPLKFVSDEVKIKAKSGYVAYVGEVSKGYCEGKGSLFGKSGNLIYEGEFSQSMFNGSGKQYYDSGATQYVGNFVDNVYEGTGTLYRENGSTEYVGEFVNGYKEGKGTLKDSGNNDVFTGNFLKNDILFPDFLGKTTQDASSMYTGEKIIYQDEDYFLVDMTQINAMYCAKATQNKLDEETIVEGVYVLRDKFVYQGKLYSNMKELKQAVEELNYDGNSYLMMPEAVAIKNLISKGNTKFQDFQMNTSDVFDDVITVDSYDQNYVLYLYTFIDDSNVYTFFSDNNSGNFDFYSIEQIK